MHPQVSRRLTLLMIIVLTGLLERPAPAALTVGTNLNVTKLAGNQTETTVAINPLNPQNLFVASNNGTFPTPSVFFFSTNGGANWSASDVSALPTACCDESSAWDSFGNLFVTYLTVIGSTAAVAVSTNGGASFTLLFQSTNNIDQPSIAVGPGGSYAPGGVWITLAGPSGLTVHSAAVNGFGSVGVFSSEEIAPGPGGSFGDIAVGPEGQVLVTYQNTLNASSDGIFVNLDPDGLGPAGFNAVITATTTLVNGYLAIPAQPKRKIDAEAGLAWDRTAGPNNGAIYLVYTDRPNSTSADTDIYVRRSNDNGTTWGAAVRVNDDPAGKSQFLPRIALDQTTGNLAVSFYDCRNSSGNNTAQIWASVSTDGGFTFLPNVKVSPGTNSALVTAVSVSGFDYGDYTGLAFNAGVFYPCWGDNSNHTGDNPDGTLHTLDVYITAVTVPPNSPPLTISLAGANVILSWPSFATGGFQLEQTPTLSPPAWGGVTNAVADDGVTRTVTLPINLADNFYRLKK